MAKKRPKQIPNLYSRGYCVLCHCTGVKQMQVKYLSMITWSCRSQVTLEFDPPSFYIAPFYTPPPPFLSEAHAWYEYEHFARCTHFTQLAHFTHLLRPHSGPDLGKWAAGGGRGTSKITEPGQASVHTPKITQIIIVKYCPGPSYSPGKRSDGFMLCAKSTCFLLTLCQPCVFKLYLRLRRWQ